jgi:hypothetical protein
MQAGSVLAAAAAKQLGQSGRAISLSIEDVRQQVREVSLFKLCVLACNDKMQCGFSALPGG